MCTGGEFGKASSSLSGDGGFAIRGGPMWEMGVRNVDDTRRDVYRLVVCMGVISTAGGRWSAVGAICGKVGARCGTIGMCRNVEGARWSSLGMYCDTEGVRCGTTGGTRFAITGAWCGTEGARCVARKAAAAGGFDAPSDMADTIAFGKCLGEYRCVP